MNNNVMQFMTQNMIISVTQSLRKFAVQLMTRFVILHSLRMEEIHSVVPQIHMDLLLHPLVDKFQDRNVHQFQRKNVKLSLGKFKDKSA